LESNWRWNAADIGLIGEWPGVFDARRTARFAARLRTPFDTVFGEATHVLGVALGRRVESMYLTRRLTNYPIWVFPVVRQPPFRYPDQWDVLPD